MSAMERESQRIALMPRMAPDWQTDAFETTAKKRAIVLSAPEVYAEVSHLGAEKAKYSWKKLIILTIMAGTYVGLGASSGVLVGGSLTQSPHNPDKTQVNVGVFRLVYGFIGLPLGFICIVNCGADLFTSMCLYMTTAWWDKKIPLTSLLRIYVVSWIGNFAGCSIIACMYYLAGTFNGQDGYLSYMVEHKVQETWVQVFFRGIFANFLVCITTWMTNAALDFTGKVFAIWLPISVLAMLGYEHSIANMFYFIMALLQGIHLTAEQIFWRNLIPATLGNIIGGGLCFATVYSFAYGKADLKLLKYRYVK
jgi:formate/nitrite transporter